MVKCPDCGKPVESDQKTCPVCDARVAPLTKEIAAQIKAVNDRIKKDEQNPQLYIELGDLYVNNECLKEGLAEYQKILTFDDANFEAYARSAATCIRLKVFDRAETFYRKALRIDPRSKESYNGLFLSYYRQDKFDEALILGVKLERADPKNVEVHRILYDIYFRTNVQDKAQNELNILETLVPDDKFILKERARYFKEKENTEKFVEYSKKLLQVDPADVEARVGMGKHCFENGDYQKTVELFMPLVNEKKLSPAIATVIPVYMSMAYAKLGDEQKALEHARTIHADGTFCTIEERKLFGAYFYDLGLSELEKNVKQSEVFLEKAVHYDTENQRYLKLLETAKGMITNAARSSRPADTTEPEVMVKAPEEPKAEVKPEPVIVAPEKPKAEVKPEPVIVAPEKPKAEVKPEPVIVAPEEPKAEVKPEPVVKAREEPKAEVKPEPVIVAPEKPKAEVKSEPVVKAHKEPKAEVKPEPVVKAHEEPKAEIKPKPATKTVTAAPVKKELSKAEPEDQMASAEPGEVGVKEPQKPAAKAQPEPDTGEPTGTAMKIPVKKIGLIAAACLVVFVLIFGFVNLSKNEIVLKVDPADGIKVSIDGRPVELKTDKSGMILLPSLSMGNHKLIIEKAGYEKWENNVRVPFGRNAVVNADLVPRYGCLIVNSEPAGAMVLIDGKQIGVTPLVADRIISIEHLVEVSSEGYKKWSSKIIVQQSDTVDLGIIQMLNLSGLWRSTIGEGSQWFRSDFSMRIKQQNGKIEIDFNFQPGADQTYSGVLKGQLSRNEFIAEGKVTYRYLNIFYWVTVNKNISLKGKVLDNWEKIEGFMQIADFGDHSWSAVRRE